MHCIQTFSECLNDFIFFIYRSTDKVDFVRLSPMFSDYELMCGNTLEFQILPEGPEESVDITITAENAKMDEFDNGKSVILY